MQPPTAGLPGSDKAAVAYPHLRSLIERARKRTSSGPVRIGLVYPCDALAIRAAHDLRQAGIGSLVLIGPAARIQSVAQEQEVDLSAFATVNTPDSPRAAAAAAARLAGKGEVQVLMKGALHTDELMSEVVRKEAGLRTGRRISHVFLFDLPRYHKLLALTDCAVNIAPDVRAKGDILSNAIDLFQTLGVGEPKVGIVAAVETVKSSIPATLDAAALVLQHRKGAWRHAKVDGPFGFDNAICAKAAMVKRLSSEVCGDADLLLMPDLNAGNMLYKSFTYIGGGECAGSILGAKVPVVLTSRADSVLARTASAALAVLATFP